MMPPAMEIMTCVWFDGQAKAAAELYCSVFRNSRILSDGGMVVNFVLDGRQFMGLNGGPMYKPNPSISFFAVFDSAADVDAAWKALGEGGGVMMPLDAYPWAERYGWLQDRFGVSWQLAHRLAAPTTQRISPALMFTGKQAGKCEEAVDFYLSVFKDSAKHLVQRYGADEGEAEGTVKHAQFTLGGGLFAAMDSSAPHGFEFSEAISFVVRCDTQTEIDYYWEALSAGGSEGQCGWLKDKFGASWQIVPAILGSLMADKERSARVVQAFLQMKKFDLEKILRA